MKRNKKPFFNCALDLTFGIPEKERRVKEEEKEKEKEKRKKKKKRKKRKRKEKKKKKSERKNELPPAKPNIPFLLPSANSISFLSTRRGGKVVVVGRSKEEERREGEIYVSITN